MLRTSNARVLDAARPSFAPVRPNVPNNLVLGLLLGLAAGVACAFLLEQLDNTVKSQSRRGGEGRGSIPRSDSRGSSSTRTLPRANSICTSTGIPNRPSPKPAAPSARISSSCPRTVL